MAKQRHIIQRQILELTVQDEANARQLQTDVSRLYRQRIVPLIDQYCTALSDPDRIHRIESLEIDLGTINTSRLEEEFVDKLEVALHQALAAQISQQEQSNGQDSDLKSRSQLELFMFFARTGSLPWWADAQRPRLLEECLAHLLRSALEALRRSMRDLAGDRTALRRLVHHYSDELLARLVATLTPVLESSPAGTVQSMTETLYAIEAATKRGQLRPVIWANLLHVAGLAGARHETAAQFYRAVLVRLAAELDTSYKKLLAELHQLAAQAGDEQLAALKETFEELLRHHSPVPETPDAGVINELETALRAVVPHLPPPLREEALAMLARLKADGAADEAIRGIFYLLGSGLSPEDLETGLQALLASRKENGSINEAIRRLLDLLDDQPDPEKMPDSSRIIQMAERPAALPPDAEAAVDLSFSDANALYIGNAGLVILWPFLSHFFARMELLAEKQFRDSAARQRAIGLLQYLASGEASFPEYLLPLNKILCGVALGELFDFGPPLSETEAEECTALLAAVIGQAPILRDMSVSGLRGTFLLRPGVLSSRDGAWLLRVERETYDIVLDRFPWGWEWVKLPWMETPLRVEW